MREKRALFAVRLLTYRFPFVIDVGHFISMLSMVVWELIGRDNNVEVLLLYKLSTELRSEGGLNSVMKLIKPFLRVYCRRNYDSSSPN